MDLKILFQLQKKENKYIKPFIEFYLSRNFQNVKEVQVNCPDTDSQKANPDYLLVNEKILIEVKEVHEREEVETSMARVQSIKRLNQVLDNRDLTFLHGTYLFEFPWNLVIKRGTEKKIADFIISGLRNQEKIIDIEGVGRFEVIGYNNEEQNKIVFAITSSSVRSINPSGTIHQNIAPKIGTANKQLGSLKANTKILLLVNKYFFGDRINDFIEALTYSFKNLLEFNNIDEIWLQNETIDGQFLHTNLYIRDFLISLSNTNIDTNNEQHRELFEKWFYYLQKLDDEQKEKLFIALKQLLEEQKPHQLFVDKFTRQEMARLGIWLAEKGRLDDTDWIINKFIDDPDPEEPENYHGDPKFNYHQQIVKGEDPHVIITVLGNLAWVIQKLAVHKNYINKALFYTKQLSSHENLYVKLQAITPLTEIAARRQWLTGWAKRPRKGEYKEFHELAFNYINLVQRNVNYQVIAKWLTNVFAYYKDLSTEEAEKVLEALQITDESAGLFVYYGIFRQRHYKDQPDIKFDAVKLEKKLMEIIKNDDDKNHRLRESICWHLWKILDENKNEFNTLKPYIDLFLQQPYQRMVSNEIERIIFTMAKEKIDISIEWFNILLDKMIEFVTKKGKSTIQGDLWLLYTEEIIDEIAKTKPVKLLGIVEKLVLLRKLGFFIGSLQRLFESYKLIIPEKERKIVQNKFQQWYNEMVEKGLKLERVEWS